MDSRDKVDKELREALCATLALSLMTACSSSRLANADYLGSSRKIKGVKTTDAGCVRKIPHSSNR